MKKILVLAGKPIGSVEIVQKAKDLGLHTIVTDFLSPSDSPAKLYADESWNISTHEIELLTNKCLKENVSYITTGVHEFNINRMLDLTERLSLPCYCKRDTWKYCDNKMLFKQLCKKNSIPTAKTYKIEDTNISYPVITKPVDGSGSRGFHICRNYTELLLSYEDAKKHSPSNSVLIEEYIPYNAVIIHYTMVNGKCYYSGMSDKISVAFKNTGSSVMGIQTFPSIGEEEYLTTLNENVQKMFEEAGFTDGPIWIEAFYDQKKSFIFNEMGYRFGGSLTYYPIRYFYGIDQLDLYIKSCLGIANEHIHVTRKNNLKNYCILPIHIKSGNIKSIEGIDNLSQIEDFYAIAQVHFEGDKIEDWGSAQQVFCYIHVLYDSIDSLKKVIRAVLNTLHAKDEDDIDMLYPLFDINTL